MPSFFAKLSILRRALVGLMQEQRRREEFLRAHPGIRVEWPLNLLVDDPAALRLEPGCHLCAFSEIVVRRHAAESPVEGRLEIGAGAHLGMGANVRAAGGVIRIGARTQLGQHVSLIASNHLLDAETGHPRADRWDPARTGVSIGVDCWIGAGAVILPGVSVGDSAVIGAGSIVTRSVPAGEHWAGNPARPIGRS